MGTSTATSSRPGVARRYAIAVAALTLNAACAAPRPLPAGGDATVQTQTFSDKTFVSVSVNESAFATLFLVDTGATRTVAVSMERANGVTQTKWVPPLISYAWPFTFGGTWEQTYTRERPLDRESETRTVRCQVAEREERVTVPAGVFSAVRVACRFMPGGTLSYESWYAPDVGQIVRDRELTSYKR